jgi:hypothetical protein
MRLNRSSMSRWLLIAIVPLFIAGVACNRHRKDPAERIAHVQEKLQDKLDLNEAQAAKLKALGDEVLAVTLQFKAERDTDFTSVVDQVRGNIDRQALDGLINKRKSIVDEKLPGILDKLVDFHASLDNEQKAEIADWMEKLRRWRS